MVDNNKVSIPAQKPFETVYELKNKVPSYEEFMKNYEKGNVNYDDLVSGDIGTQEGYGPCSPSYCYGCSCPRSDCNCRTGESFTKLWTVCPAITCPERNNYPRYPSHWVHARDNRYTWISNQARIRCEASYCSTNHMQNWKFRCSAHRGENDYREVGREAFQKALGWALTMEKDSSTSQVISDLIEWMVTHKSEWDR